MKYYFFFLAPIFKSIKVIFLCKKIKIDENKSNFRKFIFIISFRFL